jgi:hypothetical protein
MELNIDITTGVSIIKLKRVWNTYSREWAFLNGNGTPLPTV